MTRAVIEMPRKKHSIEFVIKRIYEDASDQDGFRILVDRLWPRGMTRERAALDYWGKELAPTHELRKWFGHDPQRLKIFDERYRAELNNSHQAAWEVIARAEDSSRITLLYAAKDPTCNHAMILCDWLQKFYPTKAHHED